MTTTLSRSLLALAAAGTLALAGCSGGSAESAPSSSPVTSSPSPSPSTTKPPTSAEILKGMQAAAFKAHSVRMRGDMTLDGKPTGFEMAGAKGSQNWVANLTSAPTGGTGDIINVDGTIYIRGDREFWNAQGSVQVDDFLQGKFLKMPADPELVQSMQAYSIDNMLKLLYEDEVSASDTWGTRVEQGTLGDREVYILSDVADPNTRIYVSSDGLMQLLKAEGKFEDNTPYTVTFSEWNAVAPVTPPPADQVRELPG